MEFEIDSKGKKCTGLIAELEKAMSDSSISKVRVTAHDVPTKIDIYAWAKRKGHKIAEADPAGRGIFRMVVEK